MPTSLEQASAHLFCSHAENASFASLQIAKGHNAHLAFIYSAYETRTAFYNAFEGCGQMKTLWGNGWELCTQAKSNEVQLNVRRARAPLTWLQGSYSHEIQFFHVIRTWHLQFPTWWGPSFDISIEGPASVLAWGRRRLPIRRCWTVAYMAAEFQCVCGVGGLKSANHQLIGLAVAEVCNHNLHHHICHILRPIEPLKGPIWKQTTK